MSKIVNGHTIVPDADLSGADLSGADLSNMDLSDIDFEGANLTNANLSGSNLHYSSWDETTNLSGADLSNVSFYGDGTADGISGRSYANFNGGDFSNVADLSGADFTNLFLPNTNFSGLDLTGVNFKSATLDRANFSNSNLSGADFGDTKVTGASFTGATFAGTNLYGANVTVPSYEIHAPGSDIILSLTDSGSFSASDDFGGSTSSQAQWVLSNSDMFFPADLVPQSGPVLEPDFSIANSGSGSTLSTSREFNGHTIVPDADLSGADLSGADLSNMDLSDIDFEGANLTNANLSGSNLHYSSWDETTNLSGADLSNVSFYGDGTADGISGRSYANFNGGDFSNVADLSGADFTNLFLPNTNFSGLDLTGVNFKSATLDRANFSNSNLSGADFGDTKVTGASFTGATFAGTNLYGANVTVPSYEIHAPGSDIILSLTDSGSFSASDDFGGSTSSQAQWVLSNSDMFFPADLVPQSGPVLEPDFSIANSGSGSTLSTSREFNGHTIVPDADLSGADLSGADLSNMDLSDIDFEGANLTNANLSGSNLHYSSWDETTNLSGADLSNVSFYGDGTADGISGRSYANFNGGDFSNVADLSGADFTNLFLPNTNFSGLDLTGVNFKSATLDRANFSNSNLSGADFGDTKVTGASFTGATFAGTNLYGANVTVPSYEIHAPGVRHYFIFDRQWQLFGIRRLWRIYLFASPMGVIQLRHVFSSRFSATKRCGSGARFQHCKLWKSARTIRSNCWW